MQLNNTDKARLDLITQHMITYRRCSDSSEINKGLLFPLTKPFGLDLPCNNSGTCGHDPGSVSTLALSNLADGVNDRPVSSCCQSRSQGAQQTATP